MTNDIIYLSWEMLKNLFKIMRRFYDSRFFCLIACKYRLRHRLSKLRRLRRRSRSTRLHQRSSSTRWLSEILLWNLTSHLFRYLSRLSRESLSQNLMFRRTRLLHHAFRQHLNLLLIKDLLSSFESLSQFFLRSHRFLFRYSLINWFVALLVYIANIDIKYEIRNV